MTQAYRPFAHVARTASGQLQLVLACLLCLDEQAGQHRSCDPLPVAAPADKREQSLSWVLGEQAYRLRSPTECIAVWLSQAVDLLPVDGNRDVDASALGVRSALIGAELLARDSAGLPLDRPLEADASHSRLVLDDHSGCAGPAAIQHFPLRSDAVLPHRTEIRHDRDAVRVGPHRHEHPGALGAANLHWLAGPADAALGGLTLGRHVCSVLKESVGRRSNPQQPPGTPTSPEAWGWE